VESKEKPQSTWALMKSIVNVTMPTLTAYLPDPAKAWPEAHGYTKQKLWIVIEELVSAGVIEEN
jgi:hypothetical protein